MQEYNCSCPIFTNNNTNQCPIEDYNETMKHEFYTNYRYYKGSKAMESYCEKPCAIMKVEFGYPIIANNTENPGTAYVKLYFKTHIHVRHSHLDYPELSLFGELGGYVGLLLGVSFMDLTLIFSKSLTLLQQKFGLSKDTSEENKGKGQVLCKCNSSSITTMYTLEEQNPSQAQIELGPEPNPK